MSSSIHDVLRLLPSCAHRYTQEWLGLQLGPVVGTESSFDPNDPALHDSLLLVRRAGVSLDLITPRFNVNAHGWDAQPLVGPATDCTPCEGREVEVALAYTSGKVRARLYYYWRPELTAPDLDLLWENIKPAVQAYMAREHLEELLLVKRWVDGALLGELPAHEENPTVVATSGAPAPRADPWPPVRALVVEQHKFFDRPKFKWLEALQRYAQALTELDVAIASVEDDEVPAEVLDHQQLVLERKTRCEVFATAFTKAMGSELDDWPGWMLQAYEEASPDVKWAETGSVSEEALRAHACRLFVLQGPAAWPEPAPQPDEPPVSETSNGAESPKMKPISRATTSQLCEIEPAEDHFAASGF